MFVVRVRGNLGPAACRFSVSSRSASGGGKRSFVRLVGREIVFARGRFPEWLYDWTAGRALDQ